MGIPAGYICALFIIRVWGMPWASAVPFSDLGCFVGLGWAWYHIYSKKRDIVLKIYQGSK